MQTVKYFKSIEHVHQALIGTENLSLQGKFPFYKPEFTQTSQTPSESNDNMGFFGVRWSQADQTNCI
jgi:glucosamine-6-phosphate deaminase